MHILHGFVGDVFSDAEVVSIGVMIAALSRNLLCRNNS